MKFKLFRAQDDREGGNADPTRVPRMGGQVLPAADAPSHAATEPATPAAAPAPRPTAATGGPVGATKITARDVSVFYGDKQALYDVSLDIPDKTVTALIGRSPARAGWCRSCGSWSAGRSTCRSRRGRSGR